MAEVDRVHPHVLRRAARYVSTDSAVWEGLAVADEFGGATRNWQEEGFVIVPDSTPTLISMPSRATSPV
jgi:hypothetical protein